MADIQTPPRTAVVFDDEDLFCYLLTRILGEQDISVTTCAHPGLYLCCQPGVDSCPVEVPCVDFLITDQFMDEMTGLEFLARIKQLGCKIPDCRKAIISGNWTEETMDEARQLVPHVFEKSETKQCLARWIKEGCD